MTWVKICGITNLEDAQVAVDAGADALGFVFYEKSPRRVDVETVREIVTKLPETIEKVGVFVDEPLANVRDNTLNTGLTAVQLSAKHPGLSDLIDQRKRSVGPSKLIPAVSAEELGDGFMILDELRKSLYAILVDSKTALQPGGTGRTFDWEEAKGMIASLGLMCPTIVAGGLTPENVGEAVRLFQPFGVDVSSGTEARPGKKDAVKVRAFVKAAKEAGKRQ